MYENKMSGILIIKKAWTGAFNVLFGKPMIGIPFFVVSILELSSILGLFLFIQPPLVKYIYPVILRFWGKEFLHYPLNLILMSTIFSYLQLMLLVIFGPLAGGMIIQMSVDYFQKKELSYKKAFLTAVYKYVHLLFIALLVCFCLYQGQMLTSKILEKILNRGRLFLGIGAEDWKTIFLVFSLFFSGLIQALFIFTQPAIVIDNKNLFTALFINLKFVLTNIFTVVILTVIPLLSYLPIVLLKGNIMVLMKRVMPEIVFIILISGVIISLFINLFITVSTAKAYLIIKK